MKLQTQITGLVYDDSRLLDFKEKLQSFAITVTHPYDDGFIFNSLDWSAYELALDKYESIERSDFHVVFNIDSDLNDEMVQEIEFAMLKNKPIIMMHIPSFDKSITTVHKYILAEKMDKIILCDLTMLDDEDLRQFLEQATAKTVNYHLSNDQIKIISRGLKLYFQKLTMNKEAMMK